jgi:hypothetical protein
LIAFVIDGENAWLYVFLQKGPAKTAIECFEKRRDAPRVGEVLKKQRDLYVALGVEPPTTYPESTL